MDRVTQTYIIGNNSKINYLIDAEFGPEAKKKYNVITFSFDQALFHFSEVGFNTRENSRIIVLLQTEDIKQTRQFLNTLKEKKLLSKNVYVMAVESKPLDASTKKELENDGVYCTVSLPVPVHALEYMIPENAPKEEVAVVEEEESSHFYSYGGFMNLVF